MNCWISCSDISIKLSSNSGGTSFSSDGGQGVSSWTLLTDGIIVVSVCASNKLWVVTGRRTPVGDYDIGRDTIECSESRTRFSCGTDMSICIIMSFKSSSFIRVITKLPNTEQSSKWKGKNSEVNKQTKSVNNRKTGKTAMALTWYRHFQRNGGLNHILRRQTSRLHYG